MQGASMLLTASQALSMWPWLIMSMTWFRTTAAMLGLLIACRLHFLSTPSLLTPCRKQTGAQQL
jgi:hypothetical protein